MLMLSIHGWIPKFNYRDSLKIESMKKLIYTVISFLFISCQAQETPVVFSDAALNDTFITMDGKSMVFKEIIDTYKGQTVFIDVWASWCRDCIEGLPQLKTLQKENKAVVFLFLSLDKDMPRWKKGVKKYKIQGEHYFMQSGWDGEFGEFLKLDWIPRYMVVDKQGNIKLFKAIKITDDNLLNALQ